MEGTSDSLSSASQGIFAEFAQSDSVVVTCKFRGRLSLGDLIAGGKIQHETPQLSYRRAAGVYSLTSDSTSGPFRVSPSICFVNLLCALRRCRCIACFAAAGLRESRALTIALCSATACFRVLTFSKCFPNWRLKGE